MVLSVDVSFDFCPCSLVVLRQPDEVLLPVVSCAVVLGVSLSHKCCKCSVTGSCVKCYCVKKEGRCVNCAPGGRQRCKNGGNRLPFNKAESASDPTREALQFYNEPALPLPQSICLSAASASSSSSLSSMSTGRPSFSTNSRVTPESALRRQPPIPQVHSEMQNVTVTTSAVKSGASVQAFVSP